MSSPCDTCHQSVQCSCSASRRSRQPCHQRRAYQSPPPQGHKRPPLQHVTSATMKSGLPRGDKWPCLVKSVVGNTGGRAVFCKMAVFKVLDVSVGSPPLNIGFTMEASQSTTPAPMTRDMDRYPHNRRSHISPSSEVLGIEPPSQFLIMVSTKCGPVGLCAVSMCAC